MRCADYLNAKSCKVAAVYYEATLNNIFLKEVNSSICHSLGEYWASKSQANFADIVFRAQLLLAFPKGSALPPHAARQIATTKNLGRTSWHNKTAIVVDAGSITTATQSSHHQTKSALVLTENAPASPLTRTDIPSSSSTLPFHARSTRTVGCDPAHFTLGCLLLPRIALRNIATKR